MFINVICVASMWYVGGDGLTSGAWVSYGCIPSLLFRITPTGLLHAIYSHQVIWSVHNCVSYLISYVGGIPLKFPTWIVCTVCHAWLCTSSSSMWLSMCECISFIPTVCGLHTWQDETGKVVGSWWSQRSVIKPLNSDEPLLQPVSLSDFYLPSLFP